MRFEGTVDIAASRDTVWAFLIDPNQVGSCGPGVESIEIIDETKDLSQLLHRNLPEGSPRHHVRLTREDWQRE